MPASPPPKIQKISTGETQANDIMQAAQDRAEHRVHPQCSPANRSTVCGTSSFKKQLNPHARRTLSKAPSDPRPVARMERQWGRGWRAPGTENTPGSTADRWRAAAALRKTAPTTQIGSRFCLVSRRF
ncbi:hypothetical protein T484DRAFT_1753675 [Baffinella frigidus]|nr:hypothetical protein T484DRAFT_1753675 [Cryptophyta sp. CCMP2293]